MFRATAKVEQTLNCIKELKLPPVKTDILKATDAGPEVVM